MENKKNDLKPHYLRETDGDTFLIPCELAEDFDELIEKISNVSDTEDYDYSLDSEFDDLYSEYKIEGELYSTKLFIEK